MEGHAEPSSASGKPRLMNAMYMIMIKRVYIYYLFGHKKFSIYSLKMIFAQIQVLQNIASTFPQKKI